MDKELIAKDTETSQNGGGDNEGGDTGIDIGEECMKNGQCGMNTNKVVGVKEGKEADPEGFVQDVIYGATFFIGTVVVIGLVVSGLILIISGYDEKRAEKGKEGLKYSLYGLLLVLFSYTIIRVIQTIAAG